MLGFANISVSADRTASIEEGVYPDDGSDAQVRRSFSVSASSRAATVAAAKRAVLAATMGDVHEMDFFVSDEGEAFRAQEGNVSSVELHLVETRAGWSALVPGTDAGAPHSSLQEAVRVGRAHGWPALSRTLTDDELLCSGVAWCNTFDPLDWLAHRDFDAAPAFASVALPVKTRLKGRTWASLVAALGPETYAQLPLGFLCGWFLWGSHKRKAALGAPDTDDPPLLYTQDKRCADEVVRWLEERPRSFADER